MEGNIYMISDIKKAQVLKIVKKTEAYTDSSDFHNYIMLILFEGSKFIVDIKSKKIVYSLELLEKGDIVSLRYVEEKGFFANSTLNIHNETDNIKDKIDGMFNLNNPFIVTKL